MITSGHRLHQQQGVHKLSGRHVKHLLHPQRVFACHPINHANPAVVRPLYPLSVVRFFVCAVKDFCIIINKGSESCKKKAA